MATLPRRPPLVGEPLDQRLLQFEDEIREPSKREWQRRLDEVGRKGAVVPLGDIAPDRELVVLVPGMGMDFRDMHALSQLQDTYQTVILISDHAQPWDHGGRHIAEALEQFIYYREAIGEAQGITPSKVLRLIGHSAGTLTSQVMLYDLVHRGVLSGRWDGLFTKVFYWAIDGPWRGVDFPWIIQLLGLKYPGRRLAVHPPLRLSHGVQSAINRLGPLMNIVTQKLELPEGMLTTRHVYATGMQDTSQRLRHLEPVSSILWEELAEGEGKHLYRFLRKHGTLEEMEANRNGLDSFSPTGLTRRKGLQNLVMVLIRDYPRLIEDLRDLAQSSTLEQFGASFNAIVKRYIRTYPGQHTQFMWTTPDFLPDMREDLRNV